jgi:hypothetical protein
LRHRLRPASKRRLRRRNAAAARACLLPISRMITPFAMREQPFSPASGADIRFTRRPCSGKTIK